MPNAPAAKPPSADAISGIASGERSKIQAALLWSGDYNGAAGGDDPMITAIKNFQKRHKAKVTGELTPSERADLIAAAKAHEAEFGWSVVVDPATGIRIGLPAKLVPQARDAARGTRWSSAHGEVQVETFRIKQPGAGHSPRCSIRKRRSPPRAGSKPARCTTTISSSAACRA